MASIRKAAQDVLEEARDGIAWIALWREGRSWNTATFWPDLTKDDKLVFEGDDTDELRDIINADPHAILVNGWYHNLGDNTYMNRESLADALRWQYDLQHYTVTDVLGCGARI